MHEKATSARTAMGLPLEEVGVKIIFLGIKYSDPYNRDLILKMAEAIKEKAHPIKNSPERPKIYIIMPLSAYDYG